MMEPSVEVDAFNEMIVPVLEAMSSDRIPNVRMNVAKTITKYADKIKGSAAKGKAVGILRAMQGDTEFDVTYLAEMGLKALQ